MLEKKGVSPVQCQTATNSGNSCGGGAASGGATAGNAPQTSVADNTNGLETSVLPQNRTSGSNGPNLSNQLTSASINSTSSGPNTPTEKMGGMSGSQDFVVIKSEDQKSVSTNHCENKINETLQTNAIQTQLRNNNSIDSKTNICGNNAINRTNNAINSNNNVKCRDNAMSCPPNGPLNGPLNGIRANSTSPMNILSDDKLSVFGSELAMPVLTGTHTMSSDVPPIPLLPQSMNMMRMRGPCPSGPIQRPQMGNHMVGSHPHSVPQHLGGNTSGQKSSATMDSQYMQQQSQIFVFTTDQANKAAQAVDSGQFASIVDFHCSNPDTKRLLEKYPIKPQMNRTNSSTVWLNSLAQRQGRPIKAVHPSALKNSFGGPRGQIPGSCVSNNNHNLSGMPSGPGPGGGIPNNWPNNGNMCSNPNASPNWTSPQQQMFAQNFEINSNQKFMNSGMGPNGPITRGCAPFPSNNLQNSPQMFNNCNPGAGVGPQMAGSEIPDENLTPQQKQHREKQLAILRKMQQQLCPEMMDSPPMNRMPAPNQPPNGPDFMMDQHNMCANNMCSMGESDHLGGNDPNLNNCLTPSSMMSNPNSNSSQYSQCHSSVPPTSGPEWPKGNYLDDRRRKSQNCGQGGGLNNMCNASNSVPISHPSPLSQPSSTLNSPNPCISQSPGSRIPPPPYNQGIRPLSSPHPSSPATGSLPMPSPRMQSPADPSRPQFSSGGQSRLPHTSPSPATPSADSNSSIPGTGVHSPKPLPASSQTSMPSSTSSSTVVQNSSRNQTSTNVTNMRATTPSTSAPLSSSPSNIKKLPNHMSHTSKGMSQDMASDLMNSLSSVDQKPHPNDMSLMGGPTLQNCSSPFMCKQEPALMPVPSPQQIQYLNSFEGQELTIQKQPNTSLRDSDLISPAPDLDLGFGPEFGNNCQPFGSSERLPNFSMDNMNPRFVSNPSNANMSGHQFEPNPRFMASDNNQRFLGPMFGDGPNPRIPNHENQFRAQNMLCMPYGQMDNNMMRFNTPCDNPMGPRLRPNHPNDMVSSRFPNHPNESIQSSHQFNSSTMSPMSSEQMNLMPFPTNQSSGTGCMSSVNNFNQQMESGVSSTHLQNLQKMTPPFDIGPPNKVDQMMMSNGGPLSHNNHNPNNQLIQGSNGSMGQSMASQTQRNNNFDPISSMAAMSESNVNNHMNAQNMMSGSPMTMSGMQVAANGPNMPPGAPNLVNFHTQMNSMQGMHQNMTPEGNGMQSPYGMNPQMNPQMSGGPQTVNNTYVNATMSIQQLNIQNVSSPNFNPNLEQNMNIGPQPMSGPGMSPPSAAMQMMQNNSSGKMGPNFSHRMTGPTSGPNFSGQQMNSRGMNPMNFGGNPHNPHLMQRCSVYNSANIQIKPDAPNTIQYLPPRQQNPNMSTRPPSLDFLQRCEPPLTNLGNKLPTHNLQYFPSNNSNMNSPQSMPLGTRMMAHNMPLTSGPGRPMNPSMVRGANPNALVSGQQQMMSGPDMFGRPPGPNNMNGPPNAMFANMKPSNAGPMSPAGVPPDAAQPLPPSMSHSYNYKQSPFNAVPNDPNYAIQYQHFQQQLYATNTNRSSNTSNNNNNSGNTPRMPTNNFNNSYK